MITQKQLKELLYYDPKTGVFTWRVSTNSRAPVGSVAGCSDNKGYRLIGIGGKSYKAHRLAFLYMTGSFPENQVDHINHDPADNRWENLRNVTNFENGRNQSLHKRNKTGVPGIEKRPSGSWAVKVLRRYLGTYKDFELAEFVASEAREHFGFHPNHGARL